MRKKKFATEFLCLLIILIGFVGCDKDFITLDSDVIDSDVINNFNIRDSIYEIITYNQVLGPVQTEGTSLSNLGIYNDYFGMTKSSFVTQLSLINYSPSFGDEVEVDSVVLTIPYFVRGSEFDDDNNIIYDIDSVIGRDPIRLRVFENTYFLRDFDPGGDFDTSQQYFSNKSASETEPIPVDLLEGEELGFVTYDEDTGEYVPIDNIIDINENGYILTEPDNEDEDTEDQVISFQPPGIRVLLDPDFWVDRIISKEDDDVLESPNNFNDYFRGLYFKAEPVNGSGSHLMLNIANSNANITIYYSRLTLQEDDEADARENTTFTLTFEQNKVNFIDNEFTVDLVNGDDENGDSRLLLKGGEGSIGKIKLFNGENIDDNDDDLNTFEEWKNEFVETDSDGNYVSSKRLVNEANLVFFVDQDLITSREPERIYLYDVDNKRPLTDYFLDFPNSNLPSQAIVDHLGPLQRVGDEPDGQGIKYKIKLTEHIKNLLIRDSTNVELGLAVSLNVGIENPATNPPQREMQPVGANMTVPLSSVLSPRGTVLHGSSSEDNTKKVYLEIFYTEPNN